MSVELLLTIAKIVGITLGSILALALLLILLVLFVPIRYRLHVSKEEEIEAYGKATWLLHILSVTYRFAGRKEGLHRTIRVFGIRIFERSKAEPSDSEGGSNRAIRWGEEPETAVTEPSVTEPSVKESAITEPAAADSADTDKAASIKDTEPADTEDSEPAGKAVHQKKERKGPGIKERVTDVIGKLKRIKAFLHDETFRRALALCKGQLYRAWMAFRPRRIKGYLHFGFGDPSLTGRALGGLCMFYAFYGDSLRMIPDFEDQVLEGKLDLKGRIRVITVILIGTKLYFDKDIRRLWAMISKEEK